MIAELRYADGRRVRAQIPGDPVLDAKAIPQRWVVPELDRSVTLTELAARATRLEEERALGVEDVAPFVDGAFELAGFDAGVNERGCFLYAIYVETGGAGEEDP